MLMLMILKLLIVPDMSLLVVVGLDISSVFTPKYSGLAFINFRHELESQRGEKSQQLGYIQNTVDPTVESQAINPEDSGECTISIHKTFVCVSVCVSASTGSLGVVVV